jgi:hypothetical protein
MPIDNRKSSIARIIAARVAAHLPPITYPIIIAKANNAKSTPYPNTAYPVPIQATSIMKLIKTPTIPPIIILGTEKVCFLVGFAMLFIKPQGSKILHFSFMGLERRRLGLTLSSPLNANGFNIRIAIYHMI